jgi:hypothetical protein
MCLVLSFVVPVFAEQRDIEVVLDNTEIVLGASIRMDMIFYDADDMPVPVIPDIVGLKVSYLRSTDAISRIDGHIKRGKRYTYLIIPEKPGAFSIGPLNFVYSGNEYVLKQFDIHITSGTQRYVEPKVETVAEEEFRAKENAFLVITSDKDTVYVNETFQITATLYYKDIQVTDIEYPSLSHEGFSIGEFKPPRASRKQIKGYDYRTITFRNSAFATRPGDLRLGPAKILCNMHVSDSSKTKGFISDSTQRKVSFNLESTSRSITVLPLPQEERPESFQGAVGDFQLSLEVKPEGYIKAGEAITILTGISGKGNFAMVKAPVIKENNAFIFYAPGIESESDAGKNFKQVIIPRDSTVTEIPQIEFSFFNPITGGYVRLKKGPIAVQIFETTSEKAPTLVDDKAKAVTEKVEQEPIGEGIIYIKEKTPKFRVKGSMLYKDKTFLLLQLFPLFLYVSTALLHKRHRRFKEDIRYARAKKAQKKARAGLHQAYSVLNSGDVEKFYAYISECMQEYFGNKFNLPQAGITSDTVEKLLKSKGVESSVISKVTIFFDKCYLARFTPHRYEKKDMFETLESAKTIIQNCRNI